MRLKRKESDLKQVIAQAQGAKTRLKYSKTELENLRKKSIIKCQAVGLQNFDFLKFTICQLSLSIESQSISDVPEMN